VSGLGKVKPFHCWAGAWLQRALSSFSCISGA